MLNAFHTANFQYQVQEIYGIDSGAGEPQQSHAIYRS
jgi:hypothetical protein